MKRRENIYFPQELWRKIISKVDDFKDLLSIREVNILMKKIGTEKILSFNVPNFWSLEQSYLHPVQKGIYSSNIMYASSLKISNTDKYTNIIDTNKIKYEAPEKQNIWTSNKGIEGQLLDINMRFGIPVKIWKKDEYDTRIYFLGWWYVKIKHIGIKICYTLEKKLFN